MVAISFLLLMMVFRSVVVPLKAAVMNLLSIGAAYGVLVAVFQWGWGGSLIGLEGPTPITSIIIVLMFPILFGLSMDYEVFLLSRVREEFVKTGDNVESVARGLAGTGRVITSAALIMIVVFLSFVSSPVPSLKMLGLGLAVAILVDATIVRMVLVPATMALLGNANWWLPGWLDRILPHLTVEGTDDDPSTSTRSRPPQRSSLVADLAPPPPAPGGMPGASGSSRWDDQVPLEHREQDTRCPTPPWKKDVLQEVRLAVGNRRRAPSSAAAGALSASVTATTRCSPSTSNA